MWLWYHAHLAEFGYNGKHLSYLFGALWRHIRLVWSRHGLARLARMNTNHGSTKLAWCVAKAYQKGMIRSSYRGQFISWNRNQLNYTLEKKHFHDFFFLNYIIKQFLLCFQSIMLLHQEPMVMDSLLFLSYWLTLQYRYKRVALQLVFKQKISLMSKKLVHGLC